MGRREFALAVALATAVAGGTVGVLVIRNAQDRIPVLPAAKHAAHRDPADDGARDAAPPAAAVAAAAAAEAPPDDAPPSDYGARREIERVDEVDFPGLISLFHAPKEIESVEGTIVFRNADPNGPPLHLVVPFRNGRFRGRGPANAVVAIERISVAGLEATPREETYELATRWLKVTAIFVTPTILHVLDEASSRELTDVTLREPVHSETTKTGDGRTSGHFSLARTKRSKAPATGFDSPLHIADFGWDERRAISDRSDEARFVIVHAKGYGDDGCVVAEGERELTVRLHPAASLRVAVVPWPPTGVAADSDEARRVVTVARLFEGMPIAGAGADHLAIDVPPDLEPRLERLARDAMALRRRREAAEFSPQRHVARVDDRGIATFDDLCEATWLAWAESSADAGGSIVIVNGKQTSGRRGGAAPIDLAERTLRPEDRGELTLSSDAPEAEVATLAVRATDATSGEAVALQMEEIAVYDLDDPDSSTRPSFVGRTVGRNPRGRVNLVDARDGGDANRLFTVHPGIVVVTIRPRIHPEFEPVTRWIAAAPGENELVVPLPRTQGVVVAIETDRRYAARHVTWMESTIVRLVRDGVETPATAVWVGDADSGFRLESRFAPLDPGRYLLIVPDGVGFDRQGEIAVEVVAHQMTRVILKLRGDASAPADPGR